MSDLDNAKHMTSILFSNLWEQAIAPHIQAALGMLRLSHGEIPSRLLHFTGPAEVISILKDKKLRLYRAKTANDPLEIDYGCEIARNCVRTLASAQLRPLLLGSEKRSLAFDPHIACFTQESAQDELLHWALYGRSGIGMAMVFDGRALAANNRKVDLVRVTYDRAEHETLMNKVIGHAEAALEATKETAPQFGMSLDSVLDSIHAFADLFPVFAATMKRGPFAPEKEWRLNVSHVPDGVGTDTWTLGADVRGPVIRTFFELPFLQSDLKAIIINPEYAQLNEPVLRMLLAEYEFEDVDVRRMATPIIRAPFMAR